MPVIRLTEADKMQAVVIDKPGWYPAVVSKMEGKASKSQKSITYWTDFRVSDGKYKGKELTIAFNTETNGTQLLGNMLFMPAGNLLNLVAAIEGKTLDEVSLEFDTDKLVERALDINIDLSVPPGGAPINIITGFLPSGKGLAAGTF